MTTITSELIWDLLDEVKDPEFPVVSIVEMGIVREVKVDARKATVILTPTFAGCPALYAIRDEVSRALSQAGSQMQTCVSVIHHPGAAMTSPPRRARS